MNNVSKLMELLFFCFLMMAFAVQSSFAGEVGKFERIGGDFKITKISKLAKGGFEVMFKAAEGTPKISKLRLESDHINAGLVEGSVIRLSADVIASKGSEAEISQVVIYMPSRQGATPVWMLSKSANQITPPAKLIEMHAPSTDYAVF